MFPTLASEADRALALSELRDGFYAVSSRSSQSSRLRTIEKALTAFRSPCWPLTVVRVQMLAAVLKRGGYASAAQYLSEYKLEAERQGQTIGGPEIRALKDCKRSCERGMGQPMRAMALPFARLGELPGGREPWVVGGPLCPRNAIVAGSWFLTREVELSTARARLVEIQLSPSPHVTWCLPVSKTDQQALGVHRTHCCHCEFGGAPRACAVHVLWDQLSYLRRRFPEAIVDGHFAEDFPLFPDREGKVCSKPAMADTFRSAAEHLGLPAEVPDGSAGITGHSLRATGAQGLARLGLELWAIQLIGRWGSEAVKAYVREVPLERALLMAAQASGGGVLPRTLAWLGPDLAELLPTKKEELDAGGGSHPVTMNGSARWSRTMAATAEPLAIERALAVAPPPAVDPEWLVNRRRKDGQWVLHLAAYPLEGLPDEAKMTRCGWRIGCMAGIALTPHQPLPEEYKRICKRCAPAVRLRLRDAVVARAAVET